MRGIGIAWRDREKPLSNTVFNVVAYLRHVRAVETWTSVNMLGLHNRTRLCNLLPGNGSINRLPYKCNDVTQ
jgi:hypothetical protein